MSDDLFDEIEAFLAADGEGESLPVAGALTMNEMRAKYGDEWADDFERQLADYLKGDKGAT